MTKRHTLHVRLDEVGYRLFSVTCPWEDPRDPARPCRTFFECACNESYEAYDALDAVGGEEPCPSSPGEVHVCAGGILANPSDLCFVAATDYLSDAAQDLGPLEPGDYKIRWTCQDYDYIELEVIDD